jgi:hypothetical protein
MASEAVSAYSQKELRQLAKAFSLMGDDAISKAKTVSYDLANYAKTEITKAGYQREKSAKAVRKVVDGASVSRSSKTGRLSYGFAGQRFSGGATTQVLWRGLEFGSKNYKQFPTWSGRYGRGSRGWFIYPTLREVQPELTQRWTNEMNNVVKVWDN